MFGRFTIVAKKIGRPCFLSKKCACQKIVFFFLKKYCLFHFVSLSQKKQTAYKTLIKEQFFPQISEALGHERVQFTLVGLFSGLTIAAKFSRADPGAKRRKKYFTCFFFQSSSSSSSTFLSVPLPLPLPLLTLLLPVSLPLLLPVSLPLHLTLPLPLPLLPVFLFLSLSLFLFLFIFYCLFLFLFFFLSFPFPFPFSFSFSYYTLNRQT